MPRWMQRWKGWHSSIATVHVFMFRPEPNFSLDSWLSSVACLGQLVKPLTILTERVCYWTDTYNVSWNQHPLNEGFWALNPTMPTTNGIAFAIREKGPDDRPKSHKSRVNCHKRRIPTPQAGRQTRAKQPLAWSEFLYNPRYARTRSATTFLPCPGIWKLLKVVSSARFTGKEERFNGEGFLWLVHWYNCYFSYFPQKNSWFQGVSWEDLILIRLLIYMAKIDLPEGMVGKEEWSLCNRAAFEERISPLWCPAPRM